MVRASNAKIITGNSFWYALDSSAATVVMLIASVPVARVMGPQIMGHYIYLMFLTGIAQRLANVGLPATTGKYMAEYLGRGDTETAHEVFRVMLRYQAMIAALVTGLGLVVFAFYDPEYRFVSFLIVLSMWPALVSLIPAQANVAAENLRGNIPASVTYLLTYLILVVSSLVFHWGLVGLATATLSSRLLELVVRYRGVHQWLRKYHYRPIAPDLRRRMLNFSRQNLGLLVLGLVVWDRSEVLFLKHFSDIRQVAFYSLAFTITNQLLMLPKGVSSSIGITMFSQYGRDPDLLEGLLRNAMRYVSMLTIPMFLGLAAVAGPLIESTYGITYHAVVPVLWVLSISSIPRAFQAHTENLLQATERQGFMVKWLALMAVVNLSLDASLIPRYGALGAAVANGLTQTLAVGGLMYKAYCLDVFRSQVRFLTGVWLSSLAMATVVVLLIRGIHAPVLAVLIGVAAGMAVFASLLLFSGSLASEDWNRLESLLKEMPESLQSRVSDLMRTIQEQTSRSQASGTNLQ